MKVWVVIQMQPSEYDAAAVGVFKSLDAAKEGAQHWVDELYEEMEEDSIPPDERGSRKLEWMKEKDGWSANGPGEAIVFLINETTFET